MSFNGLNDMASDFLHTIRRNCITIGGKLYVDVFKIFGKADDSWRIGLRPSEFSTSTLEFSKLAYMLLLESKAVFGSNSNCLPVTYTKITHYSRYDPSSPHLCVVYVVNICAQHKCR